MITYEQRLDSDLNWALDEGSKHFHENNVLHRALQRITARLREMSISHAVVGDLAMFFHGFRRFTENIEILVTPAGWEAIHEKLEGRGYVADFQGSRNLRDTELGVQHKFLVTGGYPGDGQPKPVAFPDAASVAVEIKGISFLNLPTLVELKLASGMSGAGRLRDLGDVEQMISVLHLPRDFANQLNPYVRSKYGELWEAVDQAPTLE